MSRVIPCPDEERLAAFLEGKLDGDEHAGMVSHFLACEACRDALAASMGELPSKVRVPAGFLRRAMKALPETESRWEIMVRFASSLVEVIRNTDGVTRYFSPAPVPARSEGAPGAAVVVCSRRVGGVDAEIEIERIEEDRAEITVSLKESGETPGSPVRVTLKAGGRELASYLAEEGYVAFERVPLGNYTISLSRRGVTLGEIAMEMKGE